MLDDVNLSQSFLAATLRLRYICRVSELHSEDFLGILCHCFSQGP